MGADRRRVLPYAVDAVAIASRGCADHSLKSSECEFWSRVLFDDGVGDEGLVGSGGMLTERDESLPEAKPAGRHPAQCTLADSSPGGGRCGSSRCHSGTSRLFLQNTLCIQVVLCAVIH